MKKVTVLRDEAGYNAVNGTSLVGYFSVTYERLVETFGLPSSDGDGYKVDAEWILKADDGTVATVYNYKDGVNYNGPSDGVPLELITEWHIGGRGHEAQELFEAALLGDVEIEK